MQDPAQNGMAAAGEGGAAELAEALASLADALSTAQTLNDIMTVVSHAVRTVLHADGATFVLRDGDWCRYAGEDAISPLWKGRRFPIKRCMAGWCMLNRQAVAIPDVYRDPRVPAEVYRPTFVRSLAMAPVGEEKAVAVIGAYWSEQRHVDASELRRLQAIADAVAPALATVQQQAGGAERSQTARQAPYPLRTLRRLLERARQVELRPDSTAAYAFAIGCILVATLVREAVHITGVEGVTAYSTYFPAVLLAMLVGGKRAAALAAVLGGIAADFFFMAPIHVFSLPSVAGLLNFAVYGGSSALMILILDSYQRALRRLSLEDAKHFTLAREQRHRVKNALAVVESIVRQSLKGEPERARIINQRVRSGLAHVDFGDGAADEPIVLRDLLAAELQPYDLSRFALDGPDGASLAGDERMVMTLAAHELATNALKYGSLSVPHGRVTVTWRLFGRTVMLSWQESGGPPVQLPQTRGYGSIMLRRLIEAAGGALTTEFPRSGVTAQISLPLKRHQ